MEYEVARYCGDALDRATLRHDEAGNAIVRFDSPSNATRDAFLVREFYIADIIAGCHRRIASPGCVPFDNLSLVDNPPQLNVLLDKNQQLTDEHGTPFHFNEKPCSKFPDACPAKWFKKPEILLFHKIDSGGVLLLRTQDNSCSTYFVAGVSSHRISPLDVYCGQQPTWFSVRYYAPDLHGATQTDGQKTSGIPVMNLAMPNGGPENEYDINDYLTGCQQSLGCI